jgi:predicted CopG family antitoxin
MPDTPRAIRISDDLWKASLAKAQESQETVSEAIRRFLEAYISD